MKKKVRNNKKIAIFLKAKYSSILGRNKGRLQTKGKEGP